MTTRLAITVVILPGLLLPVLLLHGQDADGTSTKALIQKLGSANFKERLAATKALGERPEAEGALRDALKSGDAETRKRIAQILDYYDRRPLRELQAAAHQGRVERFTELAAVWPKGKYEEEVWYVVRDFAKQLAKLHSKKGGAKIKLSVDRFENWVPPVLVEKCLTENTKRSGDLSHYLRARQVDVNFHRLKPGTTRNRFDDSPALVVGGSVVFQINEPIVIFAGGSVELHGADGLWNALIVSGGDITLHHEVLTASLLIARGKVSVNGRVVNSRIVSGKSIAYAKDSSKDAIISENDSNPLGFIRWADVPKDKPAPKKK